MMTVRAVFVWIAAILLAIGACAAAEEGADRLVLRFQPKAGETRSLRVTTEITTVQIVNGQEFKRTQATGLSYDFTAADPGEQGGFSFEVVCRSVAGRLASLWENLEFDTAAGTVVPEAFRGMAGLAGRVSSVTVSADGAKIEIKTSKTAKSGVSVLTGDGEIDVMQILALIGLSSGQKDRLSETIRLFFAFLPEHPVGPGETWHRRLGAPGIDLGIEADAAITLRSLEQGLARLAFSGPITARGERSMRQTLEDDEAGAFTMASFAMSYDLVGELHGTCDLDALSGWPVGMSLVCRLEGRTTRFGCTYPVTIESRTVIEASAAASGAED